MDAINGVKVVDFSSYVPGPTATQILVQLGADVIKVENPRTGDGLRGMNPRVEGSGVIHLALNAGTRSIAIDRRSPHWPTVVAALARWADVAIVGSRPADAQERGFDFATLVRENANLVYCALTGYGEEGPWRDYPAHGLNMDAFAGMLPINWTESGPNLRADDLPVGTTIGGVYGALGVLAALYKRDHGGGSQYVDVAVWRAAMWWNWRNLVTYANLGHEWNPFGEVGARYNVYRTSDDRLLLVCPTERRFWESFCELLDLPEGWKARGSWADSRGDSGRAYVEEERPEIARRIAAKPLAEWVRIIGPARIPFSPVLTWMEALTSEHAEQTHVMTSTTVNGRSLPIPALPVSLRTGAATAPPEPLSSPPTIGQHTSQVLIELGLAELEGRL